MDNVRDISEIEIEKLKDLIRNEIMTENEKMRNPNFWKDSKYEKVREQIKGLTDFMEEEFGYSIRCSHVLNDSKEWRKCGGCKKELKKKFKIDYCSKKCRLIGDPEYKKAYGKSISEGKKKSFKEMPYRQFTLDWFTWKYGEEEGSRRYQKRNSKVGLTKENLIKKYGEEEGLKKHEVYRFNWVASLEKSIKKYGEEEGTKRYNETLRKRSQSLERFIEVYGEKEGRKRFQQFLDNLSHSNSLEGKIEKFGLEEGTRKYNEFIEKKAMTPELFINKYGPEEGLKRYEDWKSLSGFKIKSYIEKYGKEEGTKRFFEMVNKSRGNAKITVSKSSQKFFNRLYKKLNKSLRDQVRYHSLNGEKEVIESSIKYYLLDFCLTEKRLVIEYNGSYWHANPEKYDETFVNKTTGKTAEEIWESDKRKIEFLESEGYKVKIIWESDWMKKKDRKYNQKRIIQECLKFLES
jgi:very-short-patch-repair endonuclease